MIPREPQLSGLLTASLMITFGYPSRLQRADQAGSPVLLEIGPVLSRQGRVLA